MSNKHTLTREQLMNRLKAQISNLEYFNKGFDDGAFELASPIAVSLRVLCHESKNAKSLIKQCGLNHKEFLDTATPLNQISYTAWMPMVSTVLHKSGNSESISMKYLAHFGDHFGDGSKNVGFNQWWEKSVVIFFPISGENRYARDVWTRKKLVQIFADNYGGAHVDSTVDQTFIDLEEERKHCFKKVIIDKHGVPQNEDGKSSENGGPHHHTIRQIAYELITTIKPFTA